MAVEMMSLSILPDFMTAMPIYDNDSKVIHAA